MNFNKISRIVICLVLVCALVVNISPIKAEATASLGAVISATVVNVPVAFWVVAALVTLGVMVDVVTDPAYTSYDALVDNATTFLTDAGTYVKDGMVEMIRVVDETGKAVFYTAGDSLESLRGWLFDSATVSPLVDTVPANSTYVFHEGSEYTVTGECVVFRFNYIDADNFNYHRYFEALVKTSSSGAIKSAAGNSVNSSFTFNDRSYTYAYKSQTSFASSYPSLTAGSVNLGTLNQGSATDNMKYALSTLMTSYLAGEYDSSYRADGLSLGLVPSVPIDGTGARQWSEEYTNNGLRIVGGGSGNNNNDGKWFWPLAFGLTIAELIAMSQADQWAAETPAEFDQYETKEELTVSPGQEVEFGQSIELAPLTDPDTGTDTGGDTDSGSDSETDTSEQTWFQRFTKWFEDLSTRINELPNSFDEHFASLKENANENSQNELSTFEQGLANVIESILLLPQTISDAFKNLLQELFVPDPEFIPNKVAALQAKYTFLKPIESTFTDLKLFFQTMGTTPPIIYIDLGAATSFYPMGGKVKFIDLTWFSEYKATSDFIIGSFLWLWFAWRMLHALPGIIQGTSGMWGHFDAVPDFSFRPAPTALPGGDDPKRLGATSPLPPDDKKRLGTSRYSGSRSKREYFKHHGG